MPSFEVLLVLGAFGFYLYDSCMLLYANELIFIRANDRWDFVSPGNNYLLLGKSPYFPNPLTPHKMVFRVYWSDSGQHNPNNMESLERFMSSLIELQYIVIILLALFFLLLPLVLLFYGSGSQLLWVFALIYINIGVMLTQVYRRKEILMISTRKFILLLLESFLCAPFALNILRKLSLHRTLYGDPIKFAQNSFDKTTFYNLIDVVCRKIDEQLELIEIDSPRHSSLQSYRVRIKEMEQ